MFGIPVKTDKTPLRLQPFYEAGKQLSASQTPMSLGKGFLGFWLRRQAMGLVKGLGLGKKPPRGLQAPISTPDVWGLIYGAIITPGHPVGARLRALMRKAWSQGITGQYLTWWLEQVEEQGKFLPTMEIAKHFGVNHSTIIQNAWTPGWAKFVNLARQDKPLLGEIEKMLLSQGVPEESIPSMSFPNPQDISPRRLPNGVRPHPKIEILSSECPF